MGPAERTRGTGRVRSAGPSDADQATEGSALASLRKGASGQTDEFGFQVTKPLSSGLMLSADFLWFLRVLAEHLLRKGEQHGNRQID
jgi:hypothetical protein